MSNPTAGIGDPYWYEWTLGQKAIVHMLNPDNGIKSVVMQSNEVQGWDDVVVDYIKGYKSYFQVKHTRGSSSLTFSDLTSKNESGVSLLSYLAQQWKEVDYNERNSFIIYSNRRLSTQKYKDRPPLAGFWLHLKSFLLSNSNLEDYLYQSDFNNSIQQEWFGALSDLDLNEQYKFLSQLKIQADEPDLSELSRELTIELANYFGVSTLYGEELLKSLDNALRRWATTNRIKQEVTCEDVYKVLQKIENENYGDHKVDPPVPFFSSRKGFLQEIEKALLVEQNRVVFLSGLPGIGKTSLISELIRKNNIKIHLRYYTFKPISPGNDLLPADAGKTCEARNLWGALLNQLRVYFRGELAKYKVPIRNEFLESTESIRSEVIRLCQELAKKEKQRIVICIDGIDHAARANIDRNKGLTNYLDTLIPPERVPESIVFLIAGQPVDGYPLYPPWLKNKHDNLTNLSVSRISIDDVEQVLKDKVDPHELKGVTSIINELTEGNTLSVIYAAEMVRIAKNTHDAIEQLKANKLQEGLNTYYSKIWAHALKSLSATDPSVELKVASYFSLTTARFTPEHFYKLIPESNISSDGWELILTKLAPLLKKENGFAVLHNDIKVFFTRVVTEANAPNIYSQCATNLLTLIFSEDALKHHRFSGVSELVRKSLDHSFVFKFLNSRYIIESFHYGGSKSELETLIKYALEEGVKKRDLEAILQTSLVIRTLQKLDSIIDADSSELCWTEKDYSRYQPTEMMLAPASAWTIRQIDYVLEDILHLFQNKYEDRAKFLINNWFGNAANIQQLIDKLDDNILDDHISHSKNISQDFQFTLKQIGRISVYYPIFIHSSHEKELDKSIIAHMNEGYQQEADYIEDDRKWVRCRSPFKYSFTNSTEERIYKLIREKRWKRLIFKARKIPPTDLSGSLANTIYALTVLFQDKKLLSKWSHINSDILLKNLEGSGTSSSFGGEKYISYAATAMSMGLKHSYHDVWEVVGNIIRSVYNQKSDLTEIPAIKLLLRYSFQIGLFLKEVLNKKNIKEPIYINFKYLKGIYDGLLNYHSTFNSLHISTHSAIHFLMNFLIEGVKKSNEIIKGNFKSMIKARYSPDLVYSPYFNIFWKFLYELGDLELCKSLILNIIGENGTLWQWDYHEKFETLQDLQALTKNTEFEIIIKSANEKAYLHRIGFSSHKDYSLYSELSWFNEYIKITPEDWEVPGLRLLKFSESLPTGVDNRAGYSIMTSVLKAAVQNDYNKAFLLFKNLIKEHRYHHNIFIDAIFEDNGTILNSNNNLIVYWILSCASLYFHEYSDRKKLLSIKEEILRLCPDEQKSQISKNIENLNPAHFHIEKTIEKESTDDTKEVKLPYQDIDKNIEWAFLQKSNQSSILCYILESNSFRSLDYSEKKQKASNIINSLKYSEHLAYWSYDGMDDVYRILFPFLLDDKKWNLLQCIVSFFYSDERRYYYYFSETLECFLKFCYISNSASLKEALQQYLILHNQWVTGFEKELPESSSLPEVNNPNITSFSELSLLILIDKLTSRSGIQIDGACQGIARLLQLEKKNIEFLISHWNFWKDEQIDYILQIFEITLRKKPEYLDIIYPVLNKINKEGDFLLRAQGGLVLLAHHQVTKKGKPKIATKTSKKLSKSSIFIPNSSAHLQINTKRPFVSSDSQYYNSKISILSSVLGLDESQKEYIRNKIAHLLSVKEKDRFDADKSKLLRNDFVISDRFASKIFAEVLDHELSTGVLKGFDPFYIAQILLCNDDPMHFLETINIHPNKRLWKKEYNEKEGLKDEVAWNIMNEDIDESNTLLAAEIRFFERNLTTIAHYNTSIHENVEKKESFTFNGRSVFNLYDEAFHQDCPYDNFFIRGGGMSKLLHANYQLIPNITLFNKLDLTLDPRSPAILCKSDNKAIWLEKWIGPIFEIQMNAHQQNIVVRWVGKREIIDEIKKKLNIDQLFSFFWKENETSS